MFGCRCSRKFAVRKAEKSLEIPRKSHEKSHENKLFIECECILNYKYLYKANWEIIEVREPLTLVVKKRGTIKNFV